jgi:hypothetical protein
MEDAMKLRLALLSVLAMSLSLTAVPAMAQDLYDNSPTNGNTVAWTINFGDVVSDTFPIADNGTQITGADFAMWLSLPGDVLESAELSITSGENGGTSYFDQIVNFTQSNCVPNQSQYGSYNVCQEATSFNGPTLNSGTYWLNLQNAVVNTGDPIYWDENEGPSSASENIIGTIPSESFTLLGTNSSSTSSTTSIASVPEPSSMVLFATGILSVAGALRRNLF